MGRSTPFASKAILAVGLFGFFAPSLAEATVMVPLSIEDLSEKADAIVRGRVVNDYAAWDAAHQQISTYTEVTLTETMLAPSSLGASFVVRTLGGIVGDVGMHVSGEPTFTLGEDVLVFLARVGDEPNSFRVLGMSQGKYQIEVEGKGRLVAVADVRGIAFIRPPSMAAAASDGAALEPRPARIPYADLKARILTAVLKRTSAGSNPAAPTPTPTPTPTPRGDVDSTTGVTPVFVPTNP
ncbi:MAG: hypothetical protein IPK13_00990 [Deltaproteobacteria bacterium]|nr:hypothetical protein [Deltaproteobacteria bacterium]